MTKAEKKLKRLCDKFHDEIQAVFDSMTHEECEASEAAMLATIAQGYAYDVAQIED